jgi:hypothetical protein
VKTPTPEEQIRFLQQLQRILSDGTFVATYKYALLHALADLSVIHGEDSRGKLTLSTRQISEQVIELYWRQARPFTAPARDPLVLRQNTGSQAAIVNLVSAAIGRFGPSLANLRQQPEEWRKLISSVDGVVRKMPLWKLQTVGHERLDFLYENVDRGNSITLKAGVAYCFRAFHDLVLDLIRGAWLRFVRAQNTDGLGDITDLSAFLFGSERVSLGQYQPILMEVQKGSCFYCGTSFGRKVDVDHFIPWSRYPVDLGHNFVLSHAGCNRSKSDHLAAEPHLARWLERNEENARMLLDGFREAGLLHDLSASESIALWAYAQAERIGGRVWLEGSTLVALSDEWMHLFARRSAPLSELNHPIAANQTSTRR